MSQTRVAPRLRYRLDRMNEKQRMALIEQVGERPVLLCDRGVDYFCAPDQGVTRRRGAAHRYKIRTAIMLFAKEADRAIAHDLSLRVTIELADRR